MKKNNTKYPLPIGKGFTYRNQKYVIAKNKDYCSCDTCEEANVQYIKDNPHKCVALTKTGTRKFCCHKICSFMCYPKRIK